MPHAQTGVPVLSHIVVGPTKPSNQEQRKPIAAVATDLTVFVQPMERGERWFIARHRVIKVLDERAHGRLSAKLLKGCRYLRGHATSLRDLCRKSSAQTASHAHRIFSRRTRRSLYTARTRMAILSVPLLDLPAQYRSLQPALDEAVTRVLASGRYVMGPEVSAFEERLARHLTEPGGATPKVVAVSSGTDALLAAAMALDWGLGAGTSDSRKLLATPADRSRLDGEIITTAYSFFATPETVVRLGLRPVFVDITEDGFHPDPQAMAGQVTPQTVGFLPVHLFGQRMDLSPLAATGLPILEDAAQTLVPGLGRHSRAATLSFFPSKNLGAAGDAGAVVTFDAALFDALTILRQHGSRPKYVHSLWGGNFRMDPLQAAILSVKLAKLPAWNQARRDNAAHYHERLGPIAQAGGLRLPPSPQSMPAHVFHHFVIRTEQRNALRAFLGERSIETEVYYPLPLHLQPCFADLGYRPGSLPHAERAAQESLALPVHPDLSTAQVDAVCDAIVEFFRR